MTLLVAVVVVAGAVGAGLFVYAGWLERRNDAAIGRLIVEGKMHPDDVATLRMACRAGVPLFRHSDGRLRLSPERGRDTERVR